MAAGAIPVYFELNWAILSTIGLTTTFLSLMVIGITGFSKVSLVPVVVSISAAIANGMCYYAFYAEYPIINTVVASCFADVCWLVSFILNCPHHSYDALRSCKAVTQVTTMVFAKLWDELGRIHVD